MRFGVFIIIKAFFLLYNLETSLVFFVAIYFRKSPSTVLLIYITLLSYQSELVTDVRGSLLLFSKTENPVLVMAPKQTKKFPIVTHLCSRFL